MGYNTHGYTKGGISPTYWAYQSMKQRCLNENCRAYKYYGALGVTVCARWIESFENFLEDVGERPSPEYSLDRFPNPHGNYEPGNVRWATDVQQMRNRRDRKHYEYQGQLWLISELAEMSGKTQLLLNQRIFQSGWSIAKAVETPVRQAKRYSYRGRSLTLDQWAAVTGYSRALIENRLSQGWSFSRAITTPPQHRRYKPTYTHNGRTMTLPEWARETGKAKAMLRSRLTRGWSFAEAIELP